MTTADVPTGFRRIDSLPAFEYEMRQGSAIFTELVEKIVIGHIEAGDAIPDVLKPHALRWIKKGMGRRGRGTPSKRDRDRALYWHFVGLMPMLDDKKITIKEVCQRIAKIEGNWRLPFEIL